jgi:1-acyl-sn-glycerol-3-phosphate acyltransferase
MAKNILLALLLALVAIETALLYYIPITQDTTLITHKDKVLVYASNHVMVLGSADVAVIGSLTSVHGSVVKLGRFNLIRDLDCPQTKDAGLIYFDKPPLKLSTSE